MARQIASVAQVRASVLAYLLHRFEEAIANRQQKVAIQTLKVVGDRPNLLRSVADPIEAELFLRNAEHVARKKC